MLETGSSYNFFLTTPVHESATWISEDREIAVYINLPVPWDEIRQFPPRVRATRLCEWLWAQRAETSRPEQPG
jgi:hypothetical protein